MLNLNPNHGRFLFTYQAAGVAAQACQVAASSKHNGEEASDDEDTMHDEADEANEQLHSSKNSISPPASSFDSGNFAMFSRSPSHNTSHNTSIKSRDAQNGNNSQNHTPQSPLEQSVATSNASLPLW